MKRSDLLIDRVLCERISAGDQQAFELFFHHYKDRVLQIAFFFTRSQLRSEDIVQDVFAKIWNSRERLATIEYPDAWVATIVRNFALRALDKMAREKVRGERYADYLPAVEWNAQAPTEYKDVERYIHEALALLTEQQRSVFEMGRLQGMSRDEIADRLGLSPNTVKMHLVRGTRYVRAYLLGKLDYLTVLIIFFLKNMD